MLEDVKVNKKYKDRLFTQLFGSYEMSGNILSLYNALNRTEYDNVDELEITTIDDAVYIKMKNDVSILINSYLSLWEHQSTYNPNMPIRGLMYYGDLYNQYIKSHYLNIYGKTLIKIPNPRYIVFYNGDKELPPVMKIKLSDAFVNEDKSGEFEWTATVYNLNTGKNEELLSKCKPLADYMELVNRIKINKKNEMPIEKAVDEAIKSCIKDGIMVEYLSKHREDVMSSCITEFDEEVFIKGIREESYMEGQQAGIQRGMQRGMQQGKRQQLIELVKDGLLKITDAANKAGMTMAEFEKLMEKAK